METDWDQLLFFALIGALLREYWVSVLVFLCGMWVGFKCHELFFVPRLSRTFIVLEGTIEGGVVGGDFAEFKRSEEKLQKEK